MVVYIYIYIHTYTHRYEHEAILKPKTENNIGAPSAPQKFSPATIKVHIVCIVTYVYCLLSCTLYHGVNLCSFCLSSSTEHALW